MKISTKNLTSSIKHVVKSKILLIAAVMLLLPSIVLSASQQPPQRIVSLAPSITEKLFALDLEERIVGVTSFCDYPEQAKEKPGVGGYVNPSVEAVVRLKPDIVILTKDGNPKELEDRFRRIGIKTHVLTALTIAQLPQEIRELGNILGVNERAQRLADEIENGINELKVKNSSDKKRVIFIVWPEPLIVAGPGTTITDAIELLGWENIASDAKTRWPKFSLEEVIFRAPDVILIGNGHKKMEEISERILRRLSMLDAVKEGRVYFMSDALYRLGPRIVEGIKELKNYLNYSGSKFRGSRLTVP